MCINVFFLFLCLFSLGKFIACIRVDQLLLFAGPIYIISCITQFPVIGYQSITGTKNRPIIPASNLHRLNVVFWIFGNLLPHTIGCKGLLFAAVHVAGKWSEQNIIWTRQRKAWTLTRQRRKSSQEPQADERTGTTTANILIVVDIISLQHESQKLWWLTRKWTLNDPKSPDYCTLYSRTSV